MKRSVIFIAGVVVVVTALLFAGKNMAHRAKADNGGPLTAGDVRGRTAPNFELEVIDGKGKKMKLSDFKGKGVLLNFWATWCEPCKIEMPWIVDMQKKYASQGLQVLGVAADDSPQNEISEFAKKMGVNYPVLQGTESVADLYGGLNGLPWTFFIDRSGKIVNSKLGLMGESEFEENIKKSLAQ